MAKNWKLYLLIIAIILVALILILIFKPSHPVEPPGDLLGSWRFSGDFLQTGTETGLLLQLNQIEVTTNDETKYLGRGCMQTESSDGWAPLSLQAVFDPAGGSYALNILSTLVSPELEAGAAIIHFIGQSEMGSGRIKDDQASGIAYVTASEVAWRGEHTSAESSECPAWDEALRFQGEVGNHRDLAYDPPQDTTNFGAETLIVSAQMRVDTPDGQVVLVDYHTDIFTPHINFIDSFRYHQGSEGAPLSAQPYHFTLLDVLGQPVPLAESWDSYIYCDLGAATNLRASFDPQNYLEITWDAPALIPERFDPQNGHGLYQLTMEAYPSTGEGSAYGAEVYQPTHLAPWNNFEPGAAGLPDGHDYGISLSELADGQYIINVATYNYYDPPEGENGFDCRVTDSRQALFITKEGDQINIQAGGAISGFITDTDGNPLGEIAVQIRGTDSGFYEEVCSAENGYYLFTRLPLDSYTLSAGQFGAEACEPNGFATLIIPNVVLAEDAAVRADIDFILTP